MTPISAATANRPEPAAPRPARQPIVLVAGNPNSGKSTLFNALTGATAKVSNYPGVTVARTSARMESPETGPIELVDLPGTYSLSARSRDEQVAVDAILGRPGPAPDAVVVVTDATALARNLYFVYEVVETGVPVVVALSMMDDAAAQGIRISVSRLAAAIGVEIVPVVAPKRRGLDNLAAAISRATTRPPRVSPASPLAPGTESDIGELVSAIGRESPSLPTAARRSWAIWLLLSLDDAARDDLSGIPMPCASRRCAYMRAPPGWDATSTTRSSAGAMRASTRRWRTR